MISFRNVRNVMVFDEKEIEFIGIGYVMRCLKCNTTFIPAMRKSKAMSKKLMVDISKQFDEVLGKK